MNQRTSLSDALKISKRLTCPSFEVKYNSKPSNISRADQLSLEQRRNAINAKEEKETKKVKTKKTKEEKEEKRRRKEEKKARRKSSEENSSSGGIVSPAHSSNKPESGRLSPSSSSSDIKEVAPAVINKSSLGPPPTTSPPSASNSSPASILKDERALERHKSLKRVSFEEQPDIIDDSRESTVEAVAVMGEEEEDIPALEEVDRQPLGGVSDSEHALVRPQTPPGERYAVNPKSFVEQMFYVLHLK